MVWLPAIGLLASVGLVRASVVKRQSIPTLSTKQIVDLTPYTHFASTAYCNPSTTIGWSCGANCDANPGFQPVTTGGNGAGTQFWYVGFSPLLSTVIVAHQGTHPQNILPLLTDSEIIQKPLDSSLFPNIPSGVEVHSGFAEEQASTAQNILSAVQNALSMNSTISVVTVVGHSLGAAVALLDGVFLREQLNSSVNVNVIGYGMPRVGNQAFANFVDRELSGAVIHVNNQEDPIPTLPGMFLNYRHASGEIHIQDSGAWDNCPGQDNPSDLCVVGDVPTIFDGNLNDHDGPYAGVMMGC